MRLGPSYIENPSSGLFLADPLCTSYPKDGPFRKHLKLVDVMGPGAMDVDCEWDADADDHDDDIEMGY